MDTKKRHDGVIYRPYFTTKDGRKIWAKWYGKKAFAIPIHGADEGERVESPGLE